MPNQRGDLETVQSLRAIAALLVVAFHGVGAWSSRILHQPAHEIWANGSGGVDIFFVISGLVMMISADRVAARIGAWRIFLRQRIIRVVPLYWIMTTAKVVAILVLPASLMRTSLTLSHVVGSYFFIPMRDPNGEIYPVLEVGWTLYYEMLFYALVTTALALRVPLLAIAGPALSAFALTAIVGGFGGFAHTIMGEFANTIVIEFIFGAMIGIGIKRGIIIPQPAAALLLGLGFAFILSAPVVTAFLRPLTWGLPAACIVAGAVSLEDWLRGRIPRWILDAGDASYSIYLMHVFIIPPLFTIITRIAPVTLWLPTIVAASLLMSTAVGRFGFMWLERPLLHRLRPTPLSQQVR
jgi:exopolysaccharide production protein ExoZ